MCPRPRKATRQHLHCGQSHVQEMLHDVRTRPHQLAPTFPRNAIRHDRPRDRPGISHHTTRHEEEALKIPGLVSYRLGGLPHRRLPLFFFHVATPDALFGKFWIGGEGEGLKSNLVYFRLNPLHSSVIQTSPEGVRDEERADACGQGRGARTATRLPRNAIRHSDPV